MKKQTLLGALLIILGLVAFGGYFYFILEPLQLKYVNAGKHPSVLGSIVVGIVVGVLVGSLFHCGRALTKDQAFGVEHTSFSIEELFSSDAYWKFMACWAGGFGLASFAWAFWNF